MTDWLHGFAALAFLGASVFFLRFYRESRDRFFVWFAAAFGLLAANGVLAASLPSEKRVAVYVVRLIAFALIAAAIVNKNRDGAA